MFLVAKIFACRSSPTVCLRGSRASGPPYLLLDFQSFAHSAMLRGKNEAKSQTPIIGIGELNG